MNAIGLEAVRSYGGDRSSGRSALDARVVTTDVGKWSTLQRVGLTRAGIASEYEKFFLFRIELPGLPPEVS